MPTEFGSYRKRNSTVVGVAKILRKVDEPENLPGPNTQSKLKTNTASTGEIRTDLVIEIMNYTIQGDAHPAILQVKSARKKKSYSLTTGRLSRVCQGTACIQGYKPVIQKLVLSRGKSSKQVFSSLCYCKGHEYETWCRP